MEATESGYFLAADVFIEGERHIRDVRVMEDQEYQELARAIEAIDLFNANYSLYEICAKNYTELVRFYEKSRRTFEETHYIGADTTHPTVQEMNRLLINYLSSFRTFLDHYEKRLKNLDKQGHNFFKPFHDLTAECFDKSFAYKFFFKLRNYVQHCGMPVGGIESAVRTNEEGQITTSYSIYFSRDTLLSNYSEWTIVKPYLQQAAPRIDILSCASELQSQIEEISLFCMQIELDLMHGPWGFVSDRIAEVFARYPSAFPSVMHFTKFADGKITLHTMNFPIYTMRRIEDWANQGKLLEEQSPNDAKSSRSSGQ